MKKYFITFLVPFLVIVSIIMIYYNYKNYQKERIYRGVKSFFYRECKTKDCIITFKKDIIKQDWDSVYIIPGSSPEKIYLLKGGDNLLLSESSMSKLLFVKKDSIIYQEGFHPDVDFFDFFDKHSKTIRLKVDNVLSLTPNQAKFYVSSEDGKLFYLEWVKK